LACSDIYQTSSDSNNDGYEFETILDICIPAWFHGFLSSNDAQRALRGKPDGTFLLRFSTSNPGSYALSVAYSGTVGHWRISCEKKAFQYPVFKIDGREYKSLDHIVSTHKFGKEPLNIKQPRAGQPNFCYLGALFPRVDPFATPVADNNTLLYQNVPASPPPPSIPPRKP